MTDDVMTANTKAIVAALDRLAFATAAPERYRREVLDTHEGRRAIGWPEQSQATPATEEATVAPVEEEPDLSVLRSLPEAELNRLAVERAGNY